MVSYLPQHQWYNSSLRRPRLLPSLLQLRNNRAPLCNSCHTITECNVQLSAGDKRAGLRNARCSYRCSRSNHVARPFQRSRSIMCSKCQRLTILCELFKPATSTTTTITTVHQHLPLFASRGNRPSPMTSIPIALSGVFAVLLQTGQVWIEYRLRKRLTRILLDSCRQRTFIQAGILAGISSARLSETRKHLLLRSATRSPAKSCAVVG